MKDIKSLEERTIYTPSSSAEPTPTITPTPIKQPEQAPQATPVEQPEPTNSAPQKTADQIAVREDESALSVWQRLFPVLPNGMGWLPEYEPKNLCNKSYSNNFKTLSTQEIARLARTIYLKILRVLDTYSLLIRSSESAIQNALLILRAQMQVLSASSLNIYQDYTRGNFVPLRVDINSFLPTNNKGRYLYCSIYDIYYDLLYLLSQFNAQSPFYNQIIAIINNIKYQLSNIEQLIAAGL